MSNPYEPPQLPPMPEYCATSDGPYYGYVPNSDPSETSKLEFGSKEWYQARWRSHWAALREEIRFLERCVLQAASKKVAEESEFEQERGDAASSKSRQKRINTNYYLAFDGSDDFVKLNLNADTQKSLDFSNGLTLEVWLRPHRLDRWMWIAYLGNVTEAGAHDQILLYYDVYESTLVFEVEAPTVPDSDDTSSGDPVPESETINRSKTCLYYGLQENKWQHVAITIDREGNAYFYLDGINFNNEEHRVLPTSTERQDAYIGRAPWSSPDDYEHYYGEMREMRLWSVARTQEQILNGMVEVPSTRERKALIAYWPFDDGEGEILRDPFDEKNNGHLGGGNDKRQIPASNGHNGLVDLTNYSNRPTWKAFTVNQWHYIVLKQLELHDIAKSLRHFATASFEFFHGGFFSFGDYNDIETGGTQARVKRALSSSLNGGSKQSQINVLRQAVGNLEEEAQREIQDEREYGVPHQNVSMLNDKLYSTKEPLFYTSEQYSPNFVLGALVEQSSHDLNLLQQIYYQRSVRSGSQASTIFLIAEELGRIGLAPAAGNLLDARYRSVLCYLGNRPEVRLLPYHNTVLMGIPQSTNSISNIGDSLSRLDPNAQLIMKYPLNFTAIPHEIGHVVYRFGQFPLAKSKLHIYRLLRNRLLARPYELKPNDWRFNWLEEIFADAYSCLIAGPISVLGFQIMLADGPPQHLRGHLADHPTPVLRPLLQSQILRSVRTQYNNPLFREAPALLDARWQSWVLENWPQWVADKWLGYTDQTDIIRDALFEIDGTMMTGQEILDSLQPLIDVVMLTLERVRPEDESSTWTPNWNPTADTENLAKLYEEFVTFAYGVAENALANVQKPTPIDDGSTQRNQALFNLLTQLSGKGTDGWRARSAGIDGLIEMILFESWSDEGGNAAIGGG